MVVVEPVDELMGDVSYSVAEEIPIKRHRFNQQKWKTR